MSAQTSLARRVTPASATKELASLLGLDDPKRLGQAVTIAAVEEVQHNSAFAERLRVAYWSVPATVQRPTGGTSKVPKALAVDLVPVKHVEGFVLNPSAPLDPFLVYEAYGAKQLHTALDLFPADKLKAAATLVERRVAGAGKANRRSKATVIDYLVGARTHA
jgi:hypothetical protein